jgi:phosphoglycolate phosphatase
MILLACAKIGVEPAATLFVGDDERDIEAGRAAGCKTAAVSYGYIHPQDNPRNWGADAVVDHPLQLRTLLDNALCNC